MVSIPCYVINEFQQRVLLRCAKTKSNIVWQDDAEANHHVVKQESGSSGFCMCSSFPWASKKALLYSCLCLCRAFKLFSLIWRWICRKSQNPSLSWLIVDVFVCVCVCVCACVFVAKEEGTWEGAKCHKMQQSTSGQEKQRHRQDWQTQH